MKRITQPILICFIFFIAGCSPIVKLLYGIKPSEFETEESIKQFANKLGFPEVPIYCGNFEMWESNKQLPPVDVFVFSSTGKYIPYKDSLKPNCSGPAELFLSYLDTNNTYHYSNLYSLESFYDHLLSPNCEMVYKKDTSKFDFHVFVTFNKALGTKFQKLKSVVWIDSLKNNSRIKYDLVLVNMDLQDCWTEQQKAYFQK